MLDGVTVSYRGARYEIGQARRCYAIWAVGAPRSEPLERFPETPEGWSAAWARFMSIEHPATIMPVRTSPVTSISTEAVSAVLLVAGVACGVAGLFPPYLNGGGLARQPAELLPHALYLAAWSVTAAATVLGARQRTWALLGVGTSIVTFGLFFSDAGTVMAGGAHTLGAGLILALIGWLACTVGSAMAFRLGAVAGGPGRPRRSAAAAICLLVLAAAGAAASFAPAWDSYLLRSASGQSQTLTAGNAFANPVPVIAGDVIVMAALIVVVAAAALWRPARQGAMLLAGAAIPMVAQAISALIQVHEPTSPAQFGISPGEAAQAGITVSNGLTASFWIFCAFVLTLVVSCFWMLITPSQPAAASSPAPQAGAPEGAAGRAPEVPAYGIHATAGAPEVAAAGTPERAAEGTPEVAPGKAAEAENAENAGNPTESTENTGNPTESAENAT